MVPEFLIAMLTERTTDERVFLRMGHGGFELVGVCGGKSESSNSKYQPELELMKASHCYCSCFN